MKVKTLQIIGVTALALLLFGFFVSAYALNDRLTVKEQWLKDNAQKTEIKHEVPPVICEHGGPDGGGYYYIDSDDDASNAPRFNWIDITGSGTNMGFNGDDQLVGPFQIGFSIPFYGSNFSAFTASTNGWAGFDTYTSGAFSNASIPTSATPNNLLAVFWDDLDCRTAGSGYFWTNNRDTCVIAWINVPHYSFSGTGTYTFEIILTASGNIFYQYNSIVGTMDSYTSGIENGAGTIGTQYVYNTSRDLTGKAVYFGQTPPIYGAHDVRPSAFVSLPGFGMVGQPITPTVRFMNQGTSSESFPGHLIINHSGEVYNQTQQITNLAPATSIDITFPAFTPGAEGQFDFVAISELSGDLVPTNDTLRTSINAFAHVYSEDFEATEGGFAGDNDWQWGTPTSGPGGAHSGVNLWATILDGNYTVGPLLSTLTSPPLGLGSGGVLTFWQWYSTESTFDGGNVKISTDGGSTWELITPQSGYTGVLSTSFGNPIGGEAAFYGLSGGWVQATFDLTAYAGQSIIIKFDFGSDSSVDDPGWYIDDFVVIGASGVGPGWVNGRVTDLASGNPIDGATVRVGGRRDTTDANGSYSLQLYPSTYSVTASAEFHNDLTINGVVVVEGDTTVQNFALTAPVISVNTTAIDTSVRVGGTATFIRSISNTGNGPLDFNVSVSLGGRILTSGVKVKADYSNPAPIRLAKNDHSTLADKAPAHGNGFGPLILDFADSVFYFDPQTPTGDEACLGIEFDGSNFWVTGRHPVDEVHKLHKYDRNGNYIESFDQGTSSTWGWRDLAFDGAYLYGSDENELAQIDPATGEQVGTLPMPSSIAAPLRALAYDPETDHFWSANFSSNIIEFDRNGQTINSFANTLSIYGMAWDNASPDGPWLWAFSQDGTPATMVSQIDPATGQPTGVSFFAQDLDGAGDDLAGGACFTTAWDPSRGVIFCLVQGTVGTASADMVEGYEITPYSNWLSVSPTTGTLNAGQSVNLTITVDFTGANVVPDSIYQAIVVVASNAQGEPHIPVHVRAGQVGIDDPISNLPKQYDLSQNYPNPFNPTTEIKFALPTSGQAKLEVYNVLGQNVATLINGQMNAGYHSVTWNAQSAASGVYFYKLTAGNYSKVYQMTLMK
jgi:hypothetical protein